MLSGMAAQQAADNLNLADSSNRALARAKGAQYTADAIAASASADAEATRSAGMANLIGAGIGAVANIAKAATPSRSSGGGYSSNAAGFGGSFNSGIAPLPGVPDYSRVFRSRGAWN